MNAIKRVLYGSVSGAALLMLLNACTVSEEKSTQKVDMPSSKVELAAAYSTKLVEDRSVYADDDEGSIDNFYITVSASNKTADNPMTWAQLNSISTKDENTSDKHMEIIVQEGDETGPLSGKLGYGDVHPNAQISLRGNSTIRARADQKAYKIQLYDQEGLWRNQRTINLIKHAYDFTRLRNKLSFDYFKSIPDFTSLRTQFVHLHVKDLTSDIPGYQDYGLYTQIEQPNKTFLKSHGLDPNGHLYKATNFEFLRYADDLKTKDDPSFDDAKFEQHLEVKGNDDHTKLLKMLDDVNNVSLDINEVFDKYFDRDNFLTWLSINILMDNLDTTSQNFFLYSPLNSDKWFFLPWDYDGAWGYYEFEGVDDGGRAPWQRGIANYWGSRLENRFFKDPRNVQQLLQKMEDIKKHINPEQTSKLIETYKPIVKAFVSRAPDLTSLRYPISKWDSEVERLKQLTAVNEQAFLDTLENPMPFFLGDVKINDKKMQFNWDPSYDLQGDDITYTFQIAKSATFEKPIVKRDKLKFNSIELDALPAGHYFYKVEVTDSKGNRSVAFDTYMDIENDDHFGVKEFYID